MIKATGLVKGFDKRRAVEWPSSLMSRTFVVSFY